MHVLLQKWMVDEVYAYSLSGTREHLKRDIRIIKAEGPGIGVNARTVGRPRVIDATIDEGLHRALMVCTAFISENELRKLQGKLK